VFNIAGGADDIGLIETDFSAKTVGAHNILSNVLLFRSVDSMNVKQKLAASGRDRGWLKLVGLEHSHHDGVFRQGSERQIQRNCGYLWKIFRKSLQGTN